jgi:D-arabinose 1-dehydrogenase-like Zn-dependent alcohol dehydrogenase
MTQREPVTLPQETVTMAMMAAAICCVLISYVAVRSFELAGLGTYLVLGVGGMVVIGYVVPHVTAMWIGKSLDEIMG